MARTVLTDESGRWFDKSKAEAFEEDTYWNGQNRCSKATGSPWEHETLYYTAGKPWILYHTSSWPGVMDTYELIDNETAARWLLENDHEHPAVEREIAALEIR